jgi:hypothetical protein
MRDNPPLTRSCQTVAMSKRARLPLMTLLLLAGAPAQSQTVVAPSFDCETVASYAQVQPARKPPTPRATGSRLIVAGSTPGCAQAGGPSPDIGPISVEIDPRHRPKGGPGGEPAEPGPSGPMIGDPPLTNNRSPD